MRRALLALAAFSLLPVAIRAPRDETAPAAGILDGDVRLEHSVSVNARHAGVTDVLRKVSRITGASFSPDPDAADLRVTAFVMDRPAREVLERLAVLLQMTWRRVEDGSPASYALGVSKEQRRAIVAARAAEWERFRENIRRILRSAGRDAPATADALDRAAWALASRDPTRAAAGLLRELPGGQLEMILRGAPTLLAFSQMSPAQQESFHSFERGWRERASAGDDGPGPRVVERNGRRFTLGALPAPGPLDGAALAVSIDRRAGDGQKASLKVGMVGTGASGAGVTLGLNPQACLDIDDLLPVHRSFEDRHSADRLRSRVLLPPPNQDWERSLSAFSRANGVSVLSDAFDTAERRGIDPSVWAPAARETADRLLDRFCLPYDYTWGAAGHVVLFRQRDWYLERDRQIPERLARHWRDEGLDRGVYRVADLADMAALDEPQRQKLWKYAGMQAALTVDRARDALLLHSALTPQQRLAAATEGLTFHELQSSQLRLLGRLVSRLRPGTLGPRAAFSRLRVREATDEPKAAILLEFADGEERSVPLDCRASPARDPQLLESIPLP